MKPKCLASVSYFSFVARKILSGKNPYTFHPQVRYPSLAITVSYYLRQALQATPPPEHSSQLDQFQSTSPDPLRKFRVQLWVIMEKGSEEGKGRRAGYLFVA